MTIVYHLLIIGMTYLGHCDGHGKHISVYDAH